MADLNDEWESFLNSEYSHDSSDNVSKLDLNNEMPKCGDICISTKTKITNLSIKNINIKDIFWKIPIINYTDRTNGIIKKQVKYSCHSKENYDELQEIKKNIKCLNISTIKHVDDPNGYNKNFNYVCKINVGISKKDLLCYRTKVKKAFFNCCVLVYRIYYDNEYKEINMKIFNSGKISFPGMLTDELLVKTLSELTQMLSKILNIDIDYYSDDIDTVLINSNFNCGYYINRDKFSEILKYKYNVPIEYDPCSYPGIKCTYTKENINVSFMIFRTGSILIVGKCDETQLYDIYLYIKDILYKEYKNINMDNNVINQKKKPKKKCKYKQIYIKNEITTV
uniref:TATA-box binding protein n=1 Tax=viral metagenome TaxID=1070528 RepID=A0A6C0KGT5_9ZZZZ